MKKVLQFTILLFGLAHVIGFRLDTNNALNHRVYFKSMEDGSTTEEMTTDMPTTEDEPTTGDLTTQEEPTEAPTTEEEPTEAPTTEEPTDAPTTVCQS